MFSWFNFLAYAIVTAATPGPNNLMSMANAGKLGFRRSLPFNLGIWLGFSLVMLGCTYFCSALSGLIPKIELPMLIVGAAYMLWLAWHTFRSEGFEEAGAPSCGFGGWLLLQFVNPKIYIYCIVSMQAYVLPLYQGKPLLLAAFALLLAFIGFVFTLAWAAFGAVFAKLFSRYARITNTVMGLLLVYCAISLFI